jgi:hypothetical protein
MEKTCGNCNLVDGRVMSTKGEPVGGPCAFVDDETGGISRCTDFSRWEPSYDYLKSQLVRYQPHPFDPEKRETWPEVGKDVLAFDNVGNVFKAFAKPGAFCGVGWYDYGGYLVSTVIVGWCELPGEEGK